MISGELSQIEIHNINELLYRLKHKCKSKNLGLLLNLIENSLVEFNAINPITNFTFAHTKWIRFFGNILITGSYIAYIKDEQKHQEHILKISAIKKYKGGTAYILNPYIINWDNWSCKDAVRRDGTTQIGIRV